MAAKKKPNLKDGIASNVDELAAGSKLPITTLGGIMQRIQKVRDTAAKKDGRHRQCPSTFSRGARSISTVFCLKKDGHEGDHRGSGAQWSQAGRRTAITEKCP